MSAKALIEVAVKDHVKLTYSGTIIVDMSGKEQLLFPSATELIQGRDTSTHVVWGIVDPRIDPSPIEPVIGSVQGMVDQLFDAKPTLAVKVKGWSRPLILKHYKYDFWADTRELERAQHPHEPEENFLDIWYVERMTAQEKVSRHLA